MKNIDKVREWRLAVGHPMNTGKVSELAVKLIKEEAAEVLEAMILGDMKGLAKELCDLEYVTIGAALDAGLEHDTLHHRVVNSHDMDWAINYMRYLPSEVDASLVYALRRCVIDVFDYCFPDKNFDDAFAEVHRSNMSKLVDGKPLKREDGKVLKGPDYSPADMSFVVPGLEELKKLPHYLNPEA